MKYSEKVVEIAPSAAARMRTSSAQPKRKAGSLPQASRMKTYTPPVRGNAPATSANVNAPQRANNPPVSQIASSGAGPGSLSAILAGDRKIPEPIVEPTRTATALHNPRRRGSDEARANSESVVAVKSLRKSESVIRVR